MSIAEKLRESISLWLEGKQKRSLSMLARRSRVSYSTVRRIMQVETVPTPEVALKLAAVVMTKAELNEFAEKYMPLLAQTRTAIALKSGDDDLLEFLSDTSFVPVVLLASHKDGTSIKEVQGLFGLETTYRFQELMDAGHLVKVDDENWRLDKDIGSVNLETAREWLGAFTNICPSANDSLAKTSAAHVGWETVNFETALAVYHATIDYMRTTSKLVSDKNNKGDILIFFGSLFNVLKGQENYK